MNGSCTDGHDILPAADIALAILIVSHSHHRTVGFQTHGMKDSCTDGHDIRPAADIALAILVVSHSHHRAVGFQTHGMRVSCTDGHDIRPAADIALARVVVSHSHHRTVGFQTHGMRGSCTDGHDIRPTADIALAILVVSHSHHRAVGFQTHGMRESCTNSLPNRKGIPKIHTLLFCILIIAGLTKSDRRTGIVPGCQKALRFGEVDCRYSFGCVLILTQRSKRLCRIVKVSRIEKRFCLGVVSRQHPLRCVLIRSQSSKSFHRTGVVPGCQEFFRSLVVTSRNNHLCYHQYSGNHCHNSNDRSNSGFLSLRCCRLFSLPGKGLLPLDFCIHFGLFFLGSFLAVLCQGCTVFIAIQRIQLLCKVQELLRILFGLCAFQPRLIVRFPSG